MKKFEVLVTIGRLNVGGAERRLLQLVRSIHDGMIPIHITFYIVSGLPGVFDDQFRKAGVDIIYGRPGGFGLFKLWQLCRHLQPQVLHVNAETAAGFFALSGMLASVPLRIAHYRSMQVELTVFKKLNSLCYQLFTNLCVHKIVGVSTGSKAGRIVLRPWQTIYNGVAQPTDQEISKFPVPLNFETEKVNVSVLGRIIKTKNVRRSIEVFAELLKLNSNAALHVVGPCVDVSQEELLNRAKELHVDKFITFHGPVDEPLEFLAHSSLLLTTSLVEGLPGAIIEALSCGTPVVSSDVPGALEIEKRTTGVKCLALTQSNSEWANAIIDQLIKSRSEIRDDFKNSPFNSDCYVDEILRLWNARR